MSRSCRKTPIISNAKLRTESEKEDKKISHGMFRTQERIAIDQGEYESCPLKMREVLNPSTMSKDGKQYFPDMLTTSSHKHLMRK